MAVIRVSTPSVTMPDLLWRALERRAQLAPVAALGVFDLENCDDSSACEHIIDRDGDAADNEVA